jgi:hypothetical protein
MPAPWPSARLPVLPEETTVAGLATNFISFKEQFCAFAFTLLLIFCSATVDCYALISTSTPLGRSNLDNASTVREDEV